MAELSDFKQKEGHVQVILHTSAALICGFCNKTARVDDDQLGVRRAEKFIAKHKHEVV